MHKNVLWCNSFFIKTVKLYVLLIWNIEYSTYYKGKLNVLFRDKISIENIISDEKMPSEI